MRGVPRMPQGAWKAHGRTGGGRLDSDPTRAAAGADLRTIAGGERRGRGRCGRLGHRRKSQPHTHARRHPAGGRSSGLGALSRRGRRDRDRWIGPRPFDAYVHGACWLVHIPFPTGSNSVAYWFTSPSKLITFPSLYGPHSLACMVHIP